MTGPIQQIGQTIEHYVACRRVWGHQTNANGENNTHETPITTGSPPFGAKFTSRFNVSYYARGWLHANIDVRWPCLLLSIQQFVGVNRYARVLKTRTRTLHPMLSFVGCNRPNTLTRMTLTIFPHQHFQPPIN